MADGLVIIGAGGFGREVLDIVEAIEASGHELGFVGFVDDGDVDEDRLVRRGASLLGRTADITRFADRYVIGIGSPKAKQNIAHIADSQGLRAQTLVHPTATIGGDSELGLGCVLAAGSRVTTNVRLGNHVQLNLNSTVGHDSVLADFVSAFPCATISGGSNIGQRVTVGTGANILNGVSIGNDAYVGAGAVVIRNVDANVIVAGVPARPVTSAKAERSD